MTCFVWVRWSTSKEKDLWGFSARPCWVSLETNPEVFSMDLEEDYQAFKALFYGGNWFGFCNSFSIVFAVFI